MHGQPPRTLRIVEVSGVFFFHISFDACSVLMYIRILVLEKTYLTTISTDVHIPHNPSFAMTSIRDW